jgi:RimJ/RimL family protein N-acetyltransferase
VKGFVLNNLKTNASHLVAIVDGNVIGWCDILPNSRPILAHGGHLGIGMIKGYRGYGIGTDLIQEALRLAKLKGLTRVELTIWHTNINAISLYKKLGFEVEGTLRKAIFVDDNYVDLICMAVFI